MTHPAIERSGSQIAECSLLHGERWKELQARYGAIIRNSGRRTLATYYVEYQADGTIVDSYVKLHYGEDPDWRELFAKGLRPQDRCALEEHVASMDPTENYVVVVFESIPTKHFEMYTALLVNQQTEMATILFSHLERVATSQCAPFRWTAARPDSAI